MNYREEKEKSKQFKKEYLDGIEALIRKREKACEQERNLYIKDIFKNQDKYREDLKNYSDGLCRIMNIRIFQKLNQKCFQMRIIIRFTE